jgi:phage protein U
MDVMMQLGQVQFSVPELPILNAQRNQQYNWGRQEPLLAPPIHHYLGQGQHTLSLRGVVFSPDVMPNDVLVPPGGITEIPQTLSTNALKGYIPPISPAIANALAVGQFNYQKLRDLKKAGNPALKKETEKARVPANQNYNPLALLEAMAKTGKAYPLVDGSGRNYGNAHITQINRTTADFTLRGGALKQTYDLDLEFEELPNA